MSKPITNQKQESASVVEMDAGKFLHMINVGAQSQVALFAERIATLGEEVGQRWRLVSLDNAQLFFEDVDSNIYFQADITKLGHGKVKIENIRELRIVESKKEGFFRRNLVDLVEAIATDNTKQADEVFGRISAQRFRSSVIPENGLVTTRDGSLHRVRVADNILDESLKTDIVNAIREAVKDSAKVVRGRIVEAIFGDTQVTIPINELTRRRVVARYLKEQAKNAYKHEGFQARVQDIAALVSQDKIDEAVQNTADFLSEDQEFCMLNLREMQELTNNALAAVGCMNSILADDVGTLFYRTNCRVNYDAILNEWKQTARIAEYAPLAENVRLLGESKAFESDYQTFLNMVFTEDVSTQVAKAKMYLAALKDMKKILSGSEENADLASSLDNYIVRLEGIGDEPDDATLMEVEELVASVSEGLLKNLSDLKDYDQVPQPKEVPPEEFGAQNLAGEPGEGDEMIGGGGGGGPSLPLGEEEAPEGAPVEGEKPEGEEEELPPLPEGKQRDGEIPEISKLDAKSLRLELNEWQKNAGKFFSEDGIDSCAYHLKTCITRANVLKENDLAEGFNKILAENTPFEEIEAEPYHYNPSGAKINKEYGLNEEKEGMEAKKGGSPTGGVGMEKVKGKACAMGKAGESNMNVAPSAGHAGAKLSGGGGKIGDKKVAKESVDTDGNVICLECNGHFEPSACMGDSGAVCPDCGADVSKQMLDALAVEEIKGCGHKMDRVCDSGKGLAPKTTTSSDGRAAGSVSSAAGAVGGNQRMERVGKGSGVAPTTTQQSDGAKAGGKKDGMEGQEGKGVAERRQPGNQGMRPRGLKKTGMKTEGKELNENTQIQVSSTEPGEGITDVTFNTDKSVDQVVSRIADAMAQEPGMGGGIGDEAGIAGMGDETGMGDEMGDEAGIDGIAGAMGGDAGVGGGDETMSGEPPVDAGGPPVDAGGPPEGMGGEAEGEAAEEGAEAAEEGAEAAEEGAEAAEEGAEEAEEAEEEAEEGAPPFGGVKGGKKEEKEEDEGEGEEEEETTEESTQADGTPITEKKKWKGKVGPFTIKIKGKKDKKAKEDEEENEEEETVEAETEEEGVQRGEAVNEDEDITTPQGEDYSSEKAARKDGGTGAGVAKGGKEMNPKPKFKKSDGKAGDAPARPVGK